MKKIFKSASNLGILLSLSWATATQAFDARVLVIDEGVDLFHESLKGNALTEYSELYGLANTDDTKNGFIDNIWGWNLVSNDSNFFPDWMRSVFQQPDPFGYFLSAKEAVDFASSLEDGDVQAIRRVNEDPQLRAYIQFITGLSHGTHVAGIIQKQSPKSTQIQSMNVFSASSGPNEARTLEGGWLRTKYNLERTPSVGMASFMREVQLDFFDKLGMSEGPFKSYLDDRAALEQQVQVMRRREMASSARISAYVSSMEFQVVNLSLGVSGMNVYRTLLALWFEELNKAKLPLETEMNNERKETLYYMVNAVLEANAAGWRQLFTQNPKTLFVIAAGNDGGNPHIEDSGNLDRYPVYPAMLSREFANVLTVAAVTQNGNIARFSCYSPTFVNVAAWGVAVPSLAPENLTLKMSGTSMAAPQVAGLAARLLDDNPALTGPELKEIIMKTATHSLALENKVTTNGIINVEAALEEVRLRRPPLVPNRGYGY